MSGTSLDGVDAALVDFESQKPVLKEFFTLPYPDALKQKLEDLNQAPTLSLKSLCQLEYEVAHHFSQATKTLLNKTECQAQQIQAIGSHGQTIFHAPDVPMSLQIGHPAFIAKQTGIRTVADFRIDDLANQGQGAPLAPAFHRILFETNLPTVIVNIGGIANITYLDKEQIIGFDSGPGNGLMDYVCQTTLNEACDRNGALAAKGEVNSEWLEKWLADPYFKKPTPKSTGKEYFNANWLKETVGTFSGHSTEMVLSSLAQLTVESLIIGLSTLPKQPKSLWVCGGGANNLTLINRLQQQLTYPVNSTRADDIDPDAIEAMMCAWLAKQRLTHTPIALKTITGARSDSILGGIWEA